MAADGARGAGPAGIDRRAPRRAALGTEPPHLALAHGAVAHVLEKEGRIRAPCDGTLRRERRARAPVSRGRGAGALSHPAAAEALRASGRSRGMTQRMDAIRGKPFPASHGPCPTNVPVVPSMSHFLNLVVGHEHKFGKQGKPRGQKSVARHRKTAVTTCPTFSGRYPLYSTNLPHFFSHVRYSRKVGQVVTRGRLPPMSRRFVCPTNRLEKWDNGGTCSLLWDTFAGARLPERLPALAPPCVIPHRRPARAAGGGRSPRRRAAATAPATAVATSAGGDEPVSEGR